MSRQFARELSGYVTRCELSAEGTGKKQAASRSRDALSRRRGARKIVKKGAEPGGGVFSGGNRGGFRNAKRPCAMMLGHSHSARTGTASYLDIPCWIFCGSALCGPRGPEFPVLGAWSLARSTSSRAAQLSTRGEGQCPSDRESAFSFRATTTGAIPHPSHPSALLSTKRTASAGDSLP